MSAQMYTNFRTELTFHSLASILSFGIFNKSLVGIRKLNVKVVIMSTYISVHQLDLNKLSMLREQV